MSALYSLLPTRAYSLKEFVAYANDIKAGDPDAFSRFILTGEVEGEHQAVLDPTRNVLKAEESISIARNYNSMITFQADIIVDCPISIYLVQDPAEGVTASVHVKYPVTSGRTVTLTPIHRIPNFQFAFWNQQHTIHIFFPRLVGDGRTGPSLSREEEESFYELGLRPSIARLLPDSVSDWPVTYNSARKRSGDIYLQTKIVDSWVLRLLPDSIRSELAKNGVRWAEDLFFSHNIRGTERGTRHRCNVKSAQAALLDYLLDARIPLEATYEGIWWIDVGLEITSDDDACLQWRTSSHLQVVKEVLQIPEHQAKRITSFGSSTYARDMVGHLTAVSGCRIEPGVEAQGPFQAAYIEMYTTDKGKQHRKAMTIKTAMSRTQPPSFIEWLVNLYTTNVDDDSSKAWIKVRVPLDLARTALLGLDIGTVRGGLLSFTRSEWWEFPLTRVLGISHTLSSQVDGPAVLRVTDDALLLTAACVWLVNGLHARPDDNPAARKLLEAALPLTYRSDVGPDMLAFPARTLEENVEEEEEDDLEYTRAVPYNPFGVVFLRRVKVNLTVPRMRVGGRFLTTPAFKFLFGGTEEEIRYKYHSVGLIPSELTVRARVVTNKNKTTPIYFNFAAEPEPTLFNLAAKGHTLPPPPEDGGSDIESEPDTDPNANDIDSAVTQMWRQFLIDIAYKTPVPRGSTSPSYLRLSAPARQSVGEGFYKNSTLSEIWRSCQYKIASRDDWNLAFEHLFPPREHQTSAKVQNYRQCKYYIKWKEICSIADETSVAGIRRQLRKKIDGFFWIPHACQDKLWPTAQNKKFVRLPPDSTGPAPRLLVKKMPTWMHGDH